MDVFDAINVQRRTIVSDLTTRDIAVIQNPSGKVGMTMVPSVDVDWCRIP